tara:strand:+ start:178 stop:843 length:666 start_codon:yes stop_codon:yes gene_type:complete
MKSELLKRLISSLILIPIALFFVIKGSIYLIFFLLILYLASTYEWYQIAKKKNYLFLGIIFLSMSYYLTYSIRERGLDIFLFILTICVFTDIGGYMFGKIFKGPRLTKISPKKTYSGMFGSFLLSIIAVIIYIRNRELFSSLIGPYELKLFFYNDFNFLLVILFISLVSQIGDLVISYFKRLSKVKNTGNLIPGHGGLLDRVDGIIFAMPASYILFNFIIQ